MKVVSCWGNNTNPQYNPEKNRDGGGYLQPFGGCLIEQDNGQYVTVLLDDYSTGWFGGRYHMVVVRDGKAVLDYWSRREWSNKYLNAVVGMDFEMLHGLAYEAVSFAALRSGYQRAEWTDPAKPFRKWATQQEDAEK